MDPKRKEDLDKKWKMVATKAVTDDSYKKQLVADPVGMMAKEGIDVPEGVEVKIGTGQVTKLKPPEDASDELKDEIHWWSWRLDSIREFGKEDPKRKTDAIVMEPQEEE